MPGESTPAAPQARRPIGYTSEAPPSRALAASPHLLRSDLPRTATVRAADDTILHVGVLARERFIAA
jgi:hypothetical protein